MASVGLVPALALVAGAVCALVTDRVTGVRGVLVALALAGWIAFFFRRPRLTMACVAGGFFYASAALGIEAREAALDAPLRVELDRAFGGFDLRTIGPGARHDPIAVRATLVEDAAAADGFVSLRARVSAIRLGGQWKPTSGGVTFAVAGTAAASRIEDWCAGRALELVATFRRPARYLNDGVPDFERQLALDGTTLFGSVKSGLLVEEIGRGSRVQEAAAEIRAGVRSRIERWVAPHGSVSAAITKAVLIGDRSGLPDPIRLRLQAAGTYHVIAISGGNIAILAGVIVGVLLLCGITGRPAAWLTLLLLVGHAQIVTAGPSVWRATLMAVLYLAARLFDHRSPPWQAMALAAALGVGMRPLDVRDAGFLLTFGATAALLEAARRVSSSPRRPRATAWVMASLAASLAVELALLPVNASMFSRITGAGLALNLLAVPVMGLVQVGGIGVVLLDRIDTLAVVAGWVAHVAATALVESARLVDVAPWLVVRVPAPPPLLIVAYYAALATTLVGRGRLRVGAAIVLAMTVAAIIAGPLEGWWSGDHQPGTLRVTAFDVGQGDSTLVEVPDRFTLLVDTGGIPFGGGSFDVGARVLAPALWARSVRRLETLLVTHGDPDHIGGASSVVADFAPARIWEGIPVAGHARLSALRERASEVGTRIEQRLAGDAIAVGGVRVRVLHPPAPDWERRRVRNDDSVVLELITGEVAVLLLGDVGAGIERGLVNQLTPTRVRILKVGHHGSRTSTSRELVAQWRPQIAIISAGRGNTFGHPAPEVVQRLESIGATIYRTDLDGQITLATNGHEVHVSTYVGRGQEVSSRGVSLR